MVNKATFWQQNSFFGVDLSSLFQPALDGYFSQVIAWFLPLLIPLNTLIFCSDGRIDGSLNTFRWWWMQ